MRNIASLSSLSPSPWGSSVLMNERGGEFVAELLRIFRAVCLRSMWPVPARGAMGDIFGHRLNWVQAHTESLTDSGKKGKKGCFSNWEETRPDSEGLERGKKQEKRQMTVLKRWKGTYTFFPPSGYIWTDTCIKLGDLFRTVTCLFIIGYDSQKVKRAIPHCVI